MPLLIPKIDDRRYQDFLDEALARIPVHNPEWTNFNRSDPGVTLIEIFAFMTESLLYRANLIPERNRLKFLQLLGVQLQPAASARGLVVFTNERGPMETVTLNSELEVTAGQVPFRTDRGLDVLPIEARTYFKRKIANQDEAVLDYYRQLYASYEGAQPDDDTELALYETVLLDGASDAGVAIAEETADNSLWIALLARENEDVKLVRKEIAGKTVSLGVVPALEEASLTLSPGGQQANTESSWLLSYELPKLPPGNKLSEDPDKRLPEYKPLDARTATDVLTAPGVVEITLPSAPELELWSNLDPLEAGADDFPPTLEDTKLNSRLITWMRIRASAAALKLRLLWVGINAATVSQRTRVANEVLPDGNGEPDQIVKLSRAPVIPGTVRLFVTTGSETKEWRETDDLLSAGAEVPTPDLRLPPGAKAAQKGSPEVFLVNAESGEIKFGDGLRGKRPPLEAQMRATYDYGVGAAGNVGVGAINTSPALTAGLKVSNPIRTWGGADAETVTEGEKQVTRYLQHRERLVTVSDFETIVQRTPGIDVGRVEIIPAFNPELSPNEPGDAPGAVTVMVIPRYDVRQPDAPLPDRLFLDAICRYLDERRLVTTEIFLRPPVYKPIWISVGINVVAGRAVAEVREAVKKTLLDFLAPVKDGATDSLETEIVLQSAPVAAEARKGWALRTAVTAQTLLAEANRVSGVLFVNKVLLAEGNKAAEDQVAMNGLELPRVMGISVTVGEPLSLDQLRGTTTPTTSTGTTTTQNKRTIPIPVIPDEC